MAAVNNRYARAFADVVIEGGHDHEQLLAELRSLAEVLESSVELRAVWASPSVAGAQKRALLDDIAARLKTSRLVRNFVAVLIDNRRIAALDEIVHQFQQELNQRLGIAEAHVTSARSLDEPEKRALEQQIAHLTGKKVLARYRQDAALLGGAMVRVGSTIYDGSVRGQLQRLKEQLASG